MGGLTLATLVGLPAVLAGLKQSESSASAPSSLTGDLHENHRNSVRLFSQAA